MPIPRNPVRRRILATLVVGLALILMLLAAEAFRRHALYWYDVRRDQIYDFLAQQLPAEPVSIDSKGVLLPASEGSWDTALLHLEIAARPSGWWFEPCIVIGTGSQASRQCFERGARGSRYLLLRPGDAGPGQPLELRGEHLRWSPQTGELRRFDNQDLERGRVLVLAPHPDDAEIAAFGLYSGRESWVVTMTAGNYVDGLYDKVHDDPAVQDALRGELRSWDSIVVPQLGGVGSERVANLGYETNSLPEMARGITGRLNAAFRRGAIEELLAGRPATAEWSSVVADLRAVLVAVEPELIVAPHPALDAAPDHRYTTIALLEALQAAGDTRAVLSLYDNHHVLSEHYPFGSSATRIGPPPWFGGLQFGSVYSYELDESTQLNKLFALEAMHDLRAPPLRLHGGPAAVLRDRVRQAVDLIRRDPFGDYSYFRRAVRPNELFFVYRPQQRAALEQPQP